MLKGETVTEQPAPKRRARLTSKSHLELLAEIDSLVAERDRYKIWWERDSRGLGTVLNELSLLRAVKQDQQAQIKRFRRALEELCRRGRCPIAEEALGLDKRYP